MLINIENIGVVEFPEQPSGNYEPRVKHLEGGSYEGYWEEKPKTKEQLIKEVEDQFNASMIEVVLFREKPFIVSYAYDYQTLVLPAYKNDTDTKFIWDATKIDGLELNKADLTELYSLLAPKFEVAYQAKKQAIADILRGI